MLKGFCWGNRRKSNRLEELRKIILKWIFKKLDASVDEIDLSQDWDRRRALVKTVNETFRIHRRETD